MLKKDNSKLKENMEFKVLNFNIESMSNQH